MGVLGGISWLKPVLPRQFFSEAEGKTVDFYARVREVGQEVIDTSDAPMKSPSFTYPHAKAWVASGRAVSSVLVGEPHERRARRLRDDQRVRLGTQLRRDDHH